MIRGISFLYESIINIIFIIHQSRKTTLIIVILFLKFVHHYIYLLLISLIVALQRCAWKFLFKLWHYAIFCPRMALCVSSTLTSTHAWPKKKKKKNLQHIKFNCTTRWKMKFMILGGMRETTLDKWVRSLKGINTF